MDCEYLLWYNLKERRWKCIILFHLRFFVQDSQQKEKILWRFEKFLCFCTQMCLENWMLPYFEFTLILHIPRFIFYIAPLQYCS